jgi:hypothetical protein
VSDYLQFLEAKTPKMQPTGFEPEDLPKALKPWQAQLVRWACRQGRAAIFADCGLGKTFEQLAWADQVVKHTRKQVLVLCPLAVASQTVDEARKFSIKGVAYATDKSKAQRSRIVVTNYDRLEHFDPGNYAGVVLDESSILKAFMGKTKLALVEGFAQTPFKLCCTATPAPNDVMELGNHCEFLGVMSSHEMLARFFINDSMNMGTYRLKGHAEADFWRWVCSWAACLSTPADLLDENGQPHSADGYILPQLQLHEHVVEGPDAPPDEGELVHIANLNATTIHAEMRRTALARAELAAKLVAAEPDEPWVLWCNTDYEADAIDRALAELDLAHREVRGSQKAIEKELRLREFTEGLTKCIVTKPSLAGFGLNWQHCARHAYVGLSYSYEQLYQALRRSYRFGQKREMHAHIIGAKSESGIRATIARKQEEHRRLQARMVEVQRELQQESARGIHQVIGAGHLEVMHGAQWELHHGDSVEVLPRIPSNVVGLQVYSPPFANLYTYSASPRDMGNCGSPEEFFAHFGFMVPELLRITVPGRIACVHVKDLPRYRSSTGASGLRDFPGEVTRAMESHVGADGARWVYHSKVTIWKDPVTEMQRTKSHGLLYKTLKADSSFSRQGCPDYLLMFRKWTPDDVSAAPVKHTPEDLPLEMWQRYASPVWFDVNQQRVLNVDVARSAEDEKHMCLARGSLVLTYDGYKPIEDVEVGEEVLTHLGRWRPVLAKVCNGIKPVIKTTAQGVACLRTTADHQLLVRRAQSVFRARKEAQRAEPEWLRADATLGSYLNLRLPPVKDSNLSADEWWIVGRWLGDGHTSSRGLPFITCAFDEVDDVVTRLGARAGRTYRTRTAAQVYVKGGGKGQTSDLLHHMIRRCGEGAGGKRVPGPALGLSPELAESLLDGYLSADGHRDALGRWRASSVSRALVLGMALVAQRARGSIASVYAGRRAGEATIEGRRVTTRDEWIWLTSETNRSGFIAADGAWKKVRSLKLDGEAEVWDLKVADDESFTAEGCIVHNCPLQLDVIERCVHLWSNPGDVVFSPFAGIGSEGFAALKLGRRFQGVELKAEYVKWAKRNLDAATAQGEFELFPEERKAAANG